MGHAVYILYSEKLDRYYVGESEDPSRRLDEHRSGRYKGSATGKAKDWQLRVAITSDDWLHARRLVRWIKSQ